MNDEAMKADDHEPDYRKAMLFHSDRADQYAAERDAAIARAEAAEAVAEKLRGALDTFPPDWRDRAHSFKGAFKLQQAWADGFNAARAALTTEAGE